MPTNRLHRQVVLTALALVTLLIHGYHPFSEDGGVYAAGIRLLLDPSLYPHDRDFVTAHLHFSLFAPAVATLVHLTHLPLDFILFALYLLSIRLTLDASLRITRHIAQNPAAQLAAVTLLATWWTIPVAGTSLVLMDPYLTARSFSTPLALYAIAFTLHLLTARKLSMRSVTPIILTLAISATLHPLMTAYTLSFLLAVILMSCHHRLRSTALYAAAALTLAAIIHAFGPHESPAVAAASLSRYYWFLSRWQWYELCGLLGPLVIFTLLLHWRAARLTPAAQTLCRASLLLTCTAALVTLLFAHANGPTYLVARLQPLRALLLIYALMAILLGAVLTQRLFEIRTSRPLRILIPTLTLTTLAATMFVVQRSLYPADAHIELPWLAPRNPWQQAFLYARDHTPNNALFALDADYITTPGEDAQLFRAIAQRSQLPDFSKDGGIASITPFLAARWSNSVAAQRHLSQLDDRTRDARLLPLGVTWLLVHTSARTSHPCPYANATIKVCSLSSPGSLPAALP